MMSIVRLVTPLEEKMKSSQGEMLIIQRSFSQVVAHRRSLRWERARSLRMVIVRRIMKQAQKLRSMLILWIGEEESIQETQKVLKETTQKGGTSSNTSRMVIKNHQRTPETFSKIEWAMGTIHQPRKVQKGTITRTARDPLNMQTARKNHLTSKVSRTTAGMTMSLSLTMGLLIMIQIISSWIEMFLNRLKARSSQLVQILILIQKGLKARTTDLKKVHRGKILWRPIFQSQWREQSEEKIKTEGTSKTNLSLNSKLRLLTSLKTWAMERTSIRLLVLPREHLGRWGSQLRSHL